MPSTDFALLALAAAEHSKGVSWVDIALKTVPIAALTTAILGPASAVLVSQRQERGKRRAADLDRLQLAVLTFRSHLVHHQSRAAVRQRYDVDFLPDLVIENFVEEIVNSSLSQPGRRQKAVRAALVRIAGDMRVRMAEDIGLATSRLKDSTERDDQIKRQDARAGWHQQNYVVTGLVDTSGVLDKLSQSPHLRELHEAALREVDGLLKAVRIKRLGLKGRRPLPDAASLPDPQYVRSNS
ncbi:hypothetical protein JS756_11300 [Streptomyces actuosus]|uniref:Uncharacterized protein n=1 Tax=Streptomyces actuosus TaxID=1885 RepID=A0ABS2VNK7_STRAS|nr:hypothetical protein [Streptomyces actuosus]MBN0044683.1 hypothetical protein [Streptomyces actuosus]